jgi:hypothetical protein
MKNKDLFKGKPIVRKYERKRKEERDYSTVVWESVKSMRIVGRFSSKLRKTSSSHATRQCSEGWNQGPISNYRVRHDLVKFRIPF